MLAICPKCVKEGLPNLNQIACSAMLRQKTKQKLEQEMLYARKNKSAAYENNLQMAL
jgi:hypothetical protein